MRRPIRVLAAVAAATAFSVACQGGGGSEQSASPTPRPTSATPVPGSVQVQGFSFLPPDDLTKVENRQEQTNTNAAYEMVGDAEPPTSPPTLDVFVEKGDVGSLKVRTAQIVDLVKLQLKDAKINQNKAIEVPGAQSARLVDVSFTCTGTTGEEEIPCRQIEVLVQMPDKPQYGLRYGMATEQYDQQAVDELLTSLRASG